MKYKTALLLSSVWAIFLLVVLPVTLPLEAAQQPGFDPIANLAGVLPPGTLGLPGEQITWIVSVTNAGTVAGTSLVVTDTLRDELRIEHVRIIQGEAAVSQQTVTYTLPVLNPGQTIQIEILTTVLRSPANGALINQAFLNAQGPDGPVTTGAAAQVFVPTGLPATGYPPVEKLPGDGEPSVLAVGLVAFGVVALTAFFVWLRGRRWLNRRWSAR